MRKTQYISHCKAIILVLGFLLLSCQAVRNVPKNKSWVAHNEVLINGKNNDDANITNFISQSENNRFLTIPLGIYIYNWAPNYSKTDFFDWLDKNPKKHKLLQKILSEKQIQRLGESFLISNKIGNQIKKIGEAPVLLSEEMIYQNKNSLSTYFKRKGYFNVSVDDEITQIGNKKVKVTYLVNTNQAYVIDSLQTEIHSTELDSLYNLYKDKSFLKKGMIFNSSVFEKERNRIYSLLRNNGVYNFDKSNIRFTIKRELSMAQRDSLIHSITSITNPTQQIGDSVVETPYKIHRIGKIRVFTDILPNDNTTATDSVVYNGIHFYFKDKIKFRPDILSKAITFRSSSVYSDLKHTQTLEKINNLSSFKYPSIEYENTHNKDAKLLTNIYLSSLDKHSIELNTDVTRSNIQKFGISLGLLFITRNLFKGGENLEINTSYGFGRSSRTISEIGGDIRLTFPRILFFPKFGIQSPRTRIQLSAHKQTNIGLDRLTFNGLFQYNWFSSERSKHIVDILDLEYVNHLNPGNFFNVYQNTYYRLNNIAKNYSIGSQYFNSNKNLNTYMGAQLLQDILTGKITVKDEDLKSVRSIDEAMNRITNNDFILGIDYTYQYSNASSYNSKNFYQYKIKGEITGIVPFSESASLFARYVKTEVEIIKHWDFSAENTLAFRAFLGIALPWGGRKSIPFSRSYFGGGFNDNRGWAAYSLGPGSSNSVNDYNEANMKFSTNIEYRFPIHKSLKGAIFSDIGNIWFVAIPYVAENSKFQGIKSLKDVAIGSGIGFRYDFKYLIFRLDLGVKTYNPARIGQNRWISSLSFKDLNWNFGINYPF